MFNFQENKYRDISKRVMGSILSWCHCKTNIFQKDLFSLYTNLQMQKMYWIVLSKIIWCLQKSWCNYKPITSRNTWDNAMQEKILFGHLLIIVTYCWNYVVKLWIVESLYRHLIFILSVAMNVLILKLRMCVFFCVWKHDKIKTGCCNSKIKKLKKWLRFKILFLIKTLYCNDTFKIFNIEFHTFNESLGRYFISVMHFF